MEYDVDQGRAAEITRLVLAALGKLQIPVTPVSFALWYEFLMHGQEGLEERLEAIARGDEPYTHALGKTLFNDYVLDPDAGKLQQVAKEIRHLLSDVVVMLAGAGGEVSHYSDKLRICADTLGHTEDIGQLRTLIANLASETQGMLQHNQQFRQHLTQTSSEMSALREELSQMRAQIALDPLTGVANRREFDRHSAQLSRAQDSEKNDACLMMLDIDHFKDINDSHGHLIGDKVIKFVATTLKRLVKGRDLVARFGGDEFTVVLENTPLAGAAVLAEAIRAEIERSQIKRTDTGVAVGRLTVSIGIAKWRTEEDSEGWLARADQALYEAKSNGRNRVATLD